ncbi:MAG: YCF48-related protein [bacterium]
MKLVRISVLVIIVMTILAGVTIAQSWKQVVTQSYSGFNDVFFINATTGWIVGSAGAIYKSNDGGLTWLAQTSNTTNSLFCVFFYDANRGIIGGDKRTMLTTSNGGTTWKLDSMTALPDSRAIVKTFYFADTLRGWAMSYYSTTLGYVLHTSDGAKTWTVDLTTAINFNDMSFFEANKGIVVGKDIKTIYYTTDGVKWNRTDTTTALGGFNYTRSDIRAVYMTNATTAYATGWGSSAAGLQPSIQLKTTDGGAKWTYLTQLEADRTYENLYSMWFKDSQNGFAVGGGTKNSVIIQTTDGGTRWQPVSAPFGPTLNSVFGVGDKVWAVGSSGFIGYTAGAGQPWKMITPVPSGNLSAMQFTSANIGYAAGFEGIFLKTTDKGATWKGSYIEGNKLVLNAQDISFINDNVGYAAHSYRMLTKTTDGGATWKAVINDTLSASAYCYGVAFIDQNIGCAVGALSSSIDVIYRTTDGGVTWSEQRGKVAKALRGVAFANATVGAAVGDALTGVYTTDGGVTWTASKYNNVPTSLPTSSTGMRKLVFTSASTGFAVGNKIIVKTTDGGANWNYLNVPSAIQLNSVAFKDANTGWAVGSGEVWQTTDGGSSWKNVIDTAVVKGTLYSVAVDKAGTPWIGAASSTIYTAGAAVGVEPVSASLPVAFTLHQNYPNPFNPSTTIRFDVPVSGDVRLTVYDLLGRYIATLLDSRIAAGSYQVMFHAAGIPSGVYLYSIEMGGKTFSRTMTVIK